MWWLICWALSTFYFVSCAKEVLENHRETLEKRVWNIVFCKLTCPLFWTFWTLNMFYFLFSTHVGQHEKSSVFHCGILPQTLRWGKRFLSYVAHIQSWDENISAASNVKIICVVILKCLRHLWLTVLIINIIMFSMCVSVIRMLAGRHVCILSLSLTTCSRLHRWSSKTFRRIWLDSGRTCEVTCTHKCTNCLHHKLSHSLWLLWLFYQMATECKWLLSVND